MKWAVVIILGITVASCGIRGDLYLPKEPQQAEKGE